MNPERRHATIILVLLVLALVLLLTVLGVTVSGVGDCCDLK